MSQKSEILEGHVLGGTSSLGLLGNMPGVPNLGAGLEVALVVMVYMMLL
jgi:hypothetical protein